MVTHSLYTEDLYRSRLKQGWLWGSRGCVTFMLHFHHYLDEEQLYLSVGKREVCQMWPRNESSEVGLLPARRL